MVSWRAPVAQSTRETHVHIVVLGWLYVIGMMAITADTVVGGALLFAAAGLAPVLLALLLLARRARARGARAPSALEQEVRAADDGQSEPDQR
jgi:Flp pilus assembly protein TadB